MQISGRRLGDIGYGGCHVMRPEVRITLRLRARGRRSEREVSTLAWEQQVVRTDIDKAVDRWNLGADLA